MSAASPPGLHTTHWLRCLFRPREGSLLLTIHTSSLRFPWGLVYINCRDPFINQQLPIQYQYLHMGRKKTRPASAQKQAAGGLQHLFSHFTRIGTKTEGGRRSHSGPSSASLLVCGSERGPLEPRFPHPCTELAPGTLSEESAECPRKL